MAKFKFRLGGYLGLKEKIEDQKNLEYGKAITELEKEKQKKEKLLDEKNSVITSFRQSIEKGISPLDLQMLNNYNELLKNKIIEQDKNIKNAEINVENKRKELVEAMKERKILDKLKERNYEEYIKEEKLQEQKFLDEIVSYQYNNRES